MVQDFKLNWPNTLMTFFKNFTFLSNSSSSLLKVNCFYKNCNFSKFHNVISNHKIIFIVKNTVDTSQYVLGMVIFAILPVFFGFLSVIFWKILELTRPKIFFQTYLRNSLITSFVIIYLLYPTITSYTFGMFNCMNVEGISYLKKDFDIICWSDEH